MVQPIQPSSFEPMRVTQAREEKRKLFEIQFVTAVLSSYISISAQNNPGAEQLAKIKSKVMSAGGSLHQLVADLNHVIGQVNSTAASVKGDFPPFNFSSESGHIHTIHHCCLSLENLLKCAAEKKYLPWETVEEHLSELDKLTSVNETLSSEEAFKNLNQIVTKVNHDLLPEHQLPLIKDQLDE